MSEQERETFEDPYDYEEEEEVDESTPVPCNHWWVWMGVVPCTGDRRCLLCNVLKSELDGKED